MNRSNLRTIFLFLGAVLVMAGLSGCQDVFTYNIFGGINKDVSDMSPEERRAYYEALLASGSTTELAEAYPDIAALAEETDDPETQLIASEVAMGASGLTEGLVELTQEEEITDEEVQDVIDELDTEMLQNAVNHLKTAIALGASVTNEQYINGAVAIILLEIQTAGGSDYVDWDNDPDILLAEEWLSYCGMSMEDALQQFNIDTGA